MSGSQADSGPVGSRLPALDVFKKRISAMFSEDPQTVSRKLDRISRELRAHRQRISGRNDDQKFAYAEPIYEVTSEFRDDFFETMETLVDRHASDLVRVKAIQIFLEFGAIEAASQGAPPFGLNALISLGNIMRSSRSLENLFVTQCLQEPFAAIINNMSIEYLGVIAKEIAMWTQASNFRIEFAEGLGDCAKKFAKAHQVILPRAQLWWERATENSEDWKMHPDSNAFNYISQIINFTCASPKTAMRYIPELPIVLYTKVEVFNRIRTTYIRNGWVFPPFKIVASLSKAVAQAAEFFAGPNWDKKVVGAEAYTYYQQLRPALQYQRMMRHLLGQLDVLLWEERDNVGELVSVAYNVDTLFAIMFHSSKAVAEFLEDCKQQRAKAQNASARSVLGLQLLRRSFEFAQTSGELANACLRGFLLLINRQAPCAELLAELREEIEDNIVEVARLVQDCAQKLLTTSTDQQTEATKYALMAVLEIISAFNHPSYAHVSHAFAQEQVKNYSRDSIIFNVLDAEGASKGSVEGSGAARFIDDDVRLSAAQCLATIDVASFSQQGIQSLLDLFSAVPAVITPTRFQVLTTLMYFMFQLAVHDSETDNTTQNSGSGTPNDNQPGRVFRSLYASEISNCIFTLLERLVIEGSPEQASYWETRFMQSCIKFLMAGWVKYEFHADNLGQRPVEILSAIAVKEQQRIVALAQQFDERKKRYYRLIEQRRCVVSEDDLSTEDQGPVGQPGAYRLPSIRLKRFEHVNLSHVFYQHSFLEQTSLGARVSSLYPIIPKLKKIDIVAFRVIHQLANVVDDVSFASTVHSLSKLDFHTWNPSDPGKTVMQCDADEQRLFNAMGTSMHGSQLFRVVPVTKELLPRVSRLYDAYNKTLRKDDAKKVDDVVKFDDIWREYEDDDRAVALLVTQGRDVIAAAFAKPYMHFKRDFPGKFTLKPMAHVDMDAEARKLESVQHVPGSGNAIVEHYFFSPDMKGHVKELHRQLLAAMSHAMYVRGYCKCFFLADRHMRNTVASATANLCSADEFKGDQNGRFSCFYWFTSQNIWCFRPDHEFFVQQRIPETLLQLLLDDQNQSKMEDMKRQGKLPSQKHIIKRFKPKIRNRMEEYGGQLTTEFELTSPASPTAVVEDFVHLDTESGQKSSTERLKRFQLLVEKEFKYGLVAAGKGAYGNATGNTPVWEKIISGSKEETIVECMTRVTPAAATAPQPLLAAALLSQLPPDLNPRTNPDNWTNEWMTRELEVAAHEGVDNGAGADSKSYQKDLEQELRRRRKELAEQDAARQRDEEEAEKRRKEWQLPPVLQSWVVPSTAAVLRMLHTILTQSQQSTYKEVLKNLIVVPQDGLGMLEALKAVLTTFHYQLRGSVLDHLPASNYNIALKALDVIVCSLGTVASGLDAALASLEYVELCLELVKDICRLLFNLIQSRNSTYTAAANQGAATIPRKRVSVSADDTPAELGASSAAGVSPSTTTPTTPSSTPAASGTAAATATAMATESAIPKSGVHQQEERVMASVCKTLTALITQVSHVCLFKGSSSLISEGNRKCRQHAQQQLFTHSKILCDTVLAILLYDLEKENEVDDSMIEGETRSKSNPSLRDQARVYATELLAHFMHVDAQFRYSFFNEFCVSSIKAERSLRASFIQQVIAMSTMLKFKEKLEPFLRARRLLAQEEYVLRFAFLEHAEVERGKDHDGLKLILVTNHAYYISTESFPDDIEANMLDYMTDDKLVDFVYLERREYSDIIRLYRDFSSQVIAIRSFSQPAQARLMDAEISKRTDVFLHRGQGVADGIVSAIARCARDDTNRVHAVALDVFTPAAMLPLLESCSADSSSRMSANTTVRLMTHVWVIRRDATIVKRVMMWVTDNSNVSNSMIIITPYSPKHWDPAAGGENLEDITLAGPWEPCKYPKLQKPDDKFTQNAKPDAITSLFSVSSPSVLPGFMSAMPALPFGSLSQGGPFFFPVLEIQSVDFTEDADTDMVIRIRRTDPSRIPSVYVRFADDTGREMWRRELKKLFFGGAIGRWQENILPDLSHNSRRKQELL